VIGLLAAVNIRGLGESAKLNFLLAIADLATQIIIIVVGLFLVFDPSLLVNQIHLGTAPTYSNLIFALSLAMLAYTGIETVSNMAEEARNPGRHVPLAVNLILFAVIGVYAPITVVALSALPVLGHGTHAYTQLGSTYQNDPVLGIIDDLGLPTGLRHVLHYYVGILAATILFIAMNAGLIGLSRLSWSLAEHRQLPPIFARLHRRYRTPWFTIVWSRSSPACSSFRGRPRSSATCTRSGRCCRSRPRMWRSSRCGSRIPIGSGRTASRSASRSGARGSR
jgi:APA family basic amino acid/polyamine antiporter